MCFVPNETDSSDNSQVLNARCYSLPCHLHGEEHICPQRPRLILLRVLETHWSPCSLHNKIQTLDSPQFWKLTKECRPLCREQGNDGDTASTYETIKLRTCPTSSYWCVLFTAGFRALRKQQTQASSPALTHFNELHINLRVRPLPFFSLTFQSQFGAPFSCTFMAD